MAIWQRAMVALARNARLERFMRESAWINRLASQFVGGASADAAVARARELGARGLRASLYYLGEYVTDSALIEENSARKIEIADQLARAGLDVHVSIDPTQIGYARSGELGQRNGLRIAEHIPRNEARDERRHALMLDMEDFSIVDKTIGLYEMLRDLDLPVAITIQAYLRRSPGDIERLIGRSAAVRIVKGAFAEHRSRAWTAKADIDRAYRELAGMLLSPEAKSRGVYPSFGTHDERLAAHVAALANGNGWTIRDYEFELLFGVREPLQADLAEQGHRVRLYLPFGRAWWPYTVRRIGENPANLRFVMRAMLARFL